jgi:peptidoglycan-associated lipoprotein
MRYLAVVTTLALVLVGCATAVPREPASVDLTGRWSGSWEGYGILDIPREESVTAEFTQEGGRGYGRLSLEGTMAAETVPMSLRRAGLTGAPVLFDVSGNHVIVRHELGENLLRAEFTVTGQRMVGRLLDTALPVRIVLERERPQTAAAPVAAAPAPVTPPRPAPAPPPVVAAPPPLPPAVSAPTSASLPSPREFSAAAELKPVYFDFDRADIRPADASVLDANARWLQTNRDALVLIEGHCDERGTDAYNVALGERRGRSARDYLVAHGVAADRITTVSYGEERPVCPQHNEGCWRQNRRAEFLVKPK